jgi:hypothetical protein
MIAYMSSAKQGVNLLAITSKHLNEIYERPICSYRRSTDFFQQMVDMEPCKPFPFLQLPKELRIMIYEQFSVDTKEHNFSRTLRALPCRSFEVGLSLIDRTTPTAILATCRQLYHEARDIISSNVLELKKCLPRMILHTTNHYDRGRPTVRRVARYLLLAEWMLSNHHAVLDSSNCPSQYRGILADDDRGRILPIAMRWAQCIRYQQENVCRHGVLPAVELRVEVDADGPPWEFVNSGCQIISRMFKLEEVHMPEWCYDVRFVPHQPWYSCTVERGSDRPGLATVIRALQYVDNGTRDQWPVDSYLF